MARMIDADVASKRFRGWLEGPHEATVYNSGFDDAIWRVLDVIDHMPTLTQPNDGGKDKNVPTNGPLTLEELRPMAEPTPVWWDWVQGWVLARKGMIISWNGVYYNFEEVKGNFYRRPPEGEEEENDVIEITENL